MDRNVGIGELVISNHSEDILRTFGLASCVAVTAYSPSQGVAGMIHIALPTPPTDVNPMVRPGYYAVTGIPYFIQKLLSEYGCSKKDLRIGLYGGADSIHDDNFQIGKKNVAIIKKLLSDMKLYYSVDETGGIISRTLMMSVATGTVNITTQPIRI